MSVSCSSAVPVSVDITSLTRHRLVARRGKARAEVDGQVVIIFFVLFVARSAYHSNTGVHRIVIAAEHEVVFIHVGS